MVRMYAHGNSTTTFSPLQNRNGWLGIKHQVTYLPLPLAVGLLREKDAQWQKKSQY